MIISTFRCDTVMVCLSLRQVKTEALVEYRSEVSKVSWCRACNYYIVSDIY